MGFISQALQRDNDKYILLEDIVLMVQKLDEDEPSLADTAKFLNRAYKQQLADFPFELIDDEAFEKDINEEFVRWNSKRGNITNPFPRFLEFVIHYNCFDEGVDENSSWTEYNSYQGIYLKKDKVDEFLDKYCNIPQPSDISDLPTLPDDEPENQPTTPQQRRAVNSQVKIIAALASMYTESKGNCEKPYEAAETIRQEWERRANTMGTPLSTNTIAEYIKKGLKLFNE